MKKIFTLCLMALLTVAVKAQVTDAFQGILPVTDPAMMRSLNGDWQLKVTEGITSDLTVPAADDTWGTIPVPGCWESYGFCRANYDGPQELTGYYRTSFAVPGEWQGKRIVLRFDGVLYGYDLWINGKAVGSWRSGFNTALFDITSFINKRQQQQELAMRVISKFPGSAFDYNDDWAPNGIIRDVTLMAVPETHLSDLTIRTKTTGEVSVETMIANANRNTTVEHEILDAQGRTVATFSGPSATVGNPQLWTAETPYLYTLRTRLLQKQTVLQTFEQKFGFRELTIEGNILKLNGQPIKLRGVTHHATHPQTGKVISEELTLRDMRLMKEASVNYIRTSHYPREPRFYELADSLGFYVIDEVPFGYGDRNLSDSTYYQVLQQRAQATIRRDKNHASVLIWSLGNENPLTDICIRLGSYVKQQLDPSRPICYPQVGSYFRRFNYNFPEVADIYSPHYPTTGQIGGFYQRADRPVIFTEYCHSLGISFEDHDRQWEIIQRTPCIAGGSVWEWVDQGLAMRNNGRKMITDKTYGYEERVFTSEYSGFEMHANKGTDGLLYADRTPLPNYYELQHNYAQAFVKSIDVAARQLKIINRYDFLNLKDNVTFHWTLTNNRDTVMRGAFSPVCAPHDSTVYALQLPEQTGLALLQFDIVNAQGYAILHQSFVLNKPQPLVSLSGSAGLQPERLLNSSTQQGPMIRVGRKATMAEGLKVADKRIERYLQPIINPYVQADVQTVPEGAVTKVSYTLTPDTTDAFLSELGVAYLLDASFDRVQWIGQGPFPSYPGRYQANRYGFWAKHMDDLYFEGNRMGVDAALFSNAEGNGLLVTGDNLNINFEQTDRGIVMTVNAAVSGQGPKFARTAFPVISKEVGTVQGEFRMCQVSADTWPALFVSPQAVPAPFRPFITQYDTYLMRFSDIYAQ
ncbi:MAG: hypothetical protein IJT98_07210 [Prevotella sp.]|nr:hypothetical protein [Prevotella sp.]